GRARLRRHENPRGGDSRRRPGTRKPRAEYRGARALGRILSDRPHHRADRVRVHALAGALRGGAAALPPGAVVHGDRERHRAHRRRHDRRECPAAGDLSGAGRPRRAHDRGHSLGARRRAGDRHRAAPDVPRRHPREDVSPGGGVAMGVPHAPRRARPRPREPDATLDTLAPPGRAPHQNPPVSDAAPLVAELAPALDPFDCCARLAGLPYVVFLDSASDPDHLGRHSFITADPFTAVRAKGLLTQQLVDGDWIRIDADPLAHVRALLAPHGRPAMVDVPPFQGGAAGYVGYDWGAALERVPRPRYD